jgi:CheY-like chemotaxis protein
MGSRLARPYAFEANRADTPVSATSTTSLAQDADRRSAGFDRHLVKPVEPDLLERLLDDLSE